MSVGIDGPQIEEVMDRNNTMGGDNGWWVPEMNMKENLKNREVSPGRFSPSSPRVTCIM